jgi:hypothetical protein
MKNVQGSGGIAPHILNLGTVFYLRGKNPEQLSDWRPGGTKSEEKNPC